MNTVNIGTQTICLSNGIIFDGYQPAADPEEACPLQVLWQHWRHTIAWQRQWQHEARVGSEQDDKAFEAEADYQRTIGNKHFREV